jgi:hypothetical protein
VAQHLHRAGVRRHRPEQHEQRGRLAGAVGTEKGHALAGGHGDVHVGDHLVASEGLSERAPFENDRHATTVADMADISVRLPPMTGGGYHIAASLADPVTSASEQRDAGGWRKGGGQEA